MSVKNDLTPKRYIYNDADMAQFMQSPAKANLLKLVSAMGKSCATATTTTGYNYDPRQPLVGLSPAMASLHGSLSEMTTWIVDFPPGDRSQARFGNPTFRKWHERLESRTASIVHSILQCHKKYPGPEQYDTSVLQEAAGCGREAAKVQLDVFADNSRSNNNSDKSLDENDKAAITELCAYLRDSFGHAVRLDYGTGHECSFQVFLYGLCSLGCFGSSQHEPPSVERLKAVTISLYSAFLSVTRQLQTEYMLEPAGSHGVWGLDDYHCLPFYFGACQLQGEGDNNEFEFQSPKSIHDDAILRAEGDTYLYFGCIRYIKSLKKRVPFFESSPMLNDIANLPSWQKVAAGLLRLFDGEVLGKRQVVQHFVFGKLFSANWIPSEAPREPPTTTNFRKQPSSSSSTTGAAAAGVAPMTQAPWAKNAPPVTRAPWAK